MPEPVLALFGAKHNALSIVRVPGRQGITVHAEQRGDRLASTIVSIASKIAGLLAKKRAFGGISVPRENLTLEPGVRDHAKRFFPPWADPATASIPRHILRICAAPTWGHSRINIASVSRRGDESTE